MSDKNLTEAEKEKILQEVIADFKKDREKFQRKMDRMERAEKKKS